MSDLDKLLFDRYRLIRDLGRSDTYIRSRQVETEDGQLLILKTCHLIVSDDSAAFHQVSIVEQMKALVNQLQLSAQRPRDSLAPWLRVELQSSTLVLSRPYYERRLQDDLTLETFAGDAGRKALIRQLERFAADLEAQFQTCFDQFLLTPSNIMIDQAGDWVVTDHGILPLYLLINDSYQGPRPISEAGMQQYFFYSKMATWSKRQLLRAIDIQFMLAAIYYYLRSGHGVFEKLSNVFKPYLQLMLFGDDDNEARIERFVNTGLIELDDLPDSEERHVLELALSPASRERFASAMDFIQALRQ